MTEHELPQTTNMRVRLKAFVVCVVFSVTVYIILGLLSDAQLHMKSNVESFEAPVVRYQNGWYGGQTLIEELGFVQNPRLFPQAYHDDENLPVVITAADTDTYPDLMLFLKSFRLYFPEKRLVVYNLGFGSAERDSVRDKITVICRCQIRTVRWERFPEHCRKRHLKAYKPILVQEALVEFGAVFWCDPLTTFSSAELFLLVSQAKRVGVVSWPLVYPTSALTHPDMFQYFNTSAEKYHFHRMVDTSHFIMYNFESVHKQLMLPWVKCALDKHCIDPVGAKSTGCLFDQKPKYKYLGCHKYEMSAFNILLGPMFKFEMPYVALLDIFMMRKPQRNTWWSKWNFTIFNWFS